MKNLEDKISKLESELNELKSKEKKKELRLNTFMKYGIISALFSISFYSLASIVSLHIFTDGEIISAQKINENFQYLDNKISGIASGGGVSVNVPAHQTINVTPADNGTLYVIQNTAILNFPDVTTVDPGFTLKISLVNFAEVQMNLFGTDKLDGSDWVHFFSAQNTAYREIISTGSNWITSISSGGNYNPVDPAQLLYSNCSGKGFGNDNCYTNSSVTTAGWIVRPDNHLYQYQIGSNPYWERKIDYKYLINDPNDVFTGIDLTDNYSLGISEVKLVGGIKHSIYPWPQSINSVGNWNASVVNHAGANDDDWLNTTIPANLYNPGPPAFYNGTNCKSLYGSDWTIITPTQSSVIGDPGVDHWTSRASGLTNEFEYMSSNVSVTTTDLSTTQKYLVCVYNG